MREGYNKFLIITALYIILSIPLIVCPVFAQEKENEPNLFKLSLEELLQIEITVASKKKEPHTKAPAIVSVVSREEFEIYGDRNLVQLMQRQPSVYTRHSFVFADNLAGFRGNMATHGEYHTLILLNGRPIRESALGYNFPVYMGFPLDILESVEIIRGPGSVLYGSNAFTGVINLKTKAIPDQKELSMSAAVGSYRYYDATVTGAGRSGDFGHVTSFKTFGTKGHKYRLYDGMGVYNSDNKNEESIAAATHINYKDFKLDIFAADIDAYSLGVLPFWSNPHRRSYVKRLFANLGYRFPVHDWIDVEFNFTYNLQEDSLSSPAPDRIGTNTSDVLGEITIFAHPTENLNLVMGYLLEYRSNYQPDKNHFQSIPNYHHKPQSAYFQGDYKIGDAVKLIAGTQWQRSGQGVNDFISRYGLVVTPFKNWGFKFLRGEAFRAPVAMESDLFDPPILTGNSNLKPETITTYDAQVFYHDDKTYVAFTYFTSLIDGLIIYDFGVAPPSYMN
ncbi:MAG: TonB-dependent receptor, partial [Phycisphaerae bacterium]